MYMSEISKSKVSGLKAQKKIILWTLKHVSAISEHPVSSCVQIQNSKFVFVLYDKIPKILFMFGLLYLHP